MRRPAQASSKAGLAPVVVPVDGHEGHLEGSEGGEGLRLGDVARVDDALDPRLVEERHDARHVGQMVVGVAHDADAHAYSSSCGAEPPRPGAEPSLQNSSVSAAASNQGRYAA